MAVPTLVPEDAGVKLGNTQTWTGTGTGTATVGSVTSVGRLEHGCPRVRRLRVETRDGVWSVLLLHRSRQTE